MALRARPKQSNLLLQKQEYKLRQYGSDNPKQQPHVPALHGIESFRHFGTDGACLGTHLTPEFAYRGAHLTPEFAHLGADRTYRFAHLAPELAYLGADRTYRFAYLSSNGTYLAPEFAYLAPEFAYLGAEFAHLGAKFAYFSSEKVLRDRFFLTVADSFCYRFGRTFFKARRLKVFGCFEGVDHGFRRGSGSNMPLLAFGFKRAAWPPCKVKAKEAPCKTPVQAILRWRPPLLHGATGPVLPIIDT